MKVLYAIQGTGNGHLSRARSIIPILLNKGIDLDILVSGTQADVHIPYPVKYRLQGLSFIFGKSGGVSMWRTYLRTNSIRLQREIRELPVSHYDLVINDFEPVSAWACKLKNIPCVSFSHQVAVLSSKAPQPGKNDLLGRLILRKYAPCSNRYGLHFKNYEEDIFTPVIREEIRALKPSDNGHYTVYLPAYEDERIIRVLSGIPGATWDIFSKHNKRALIRDNIRIQPIDNDAFIKSMASCTGVLCGAGFETPAEALFLGKKLAVIPMKSQYEQQCNAEALKEMGVPVIRSLKNKHREKIQTWIQGTDRIPVDYPDITEQIIDKILKDAFIGSIKPQEPKLCAAG